MAKALLTYDIDEQHTAFKEGLEELGYSDQFVGKGDNNLPNTTMYHADKTAIQAREDARAMAKKLAVKLQRCFAVEFSMWAAISGQAHA